ncbi:MAG: tetratricopeptide repeat protein [Nitrospirota bacterium]|nr:tetratricopeptide repeat protein [Nitrospirota bacterium]
MSNPTPHNLLPLLPGFTGRESEFETVSAQVASHPVSHLCGPAGVGKTELARTVAHQLAAGGGYPGGVWHLNLTGAGAECSLTGDLILASQKGAQGLSLIVWDQVDDLLAAAPERLKDAVDNLSRDGNSRHLVVSRAALADTPGTALTPLAGDDLKVLAARSDVDAALQKATKGLDNAARRLLPILSAFPGGATGEGLHATFGDDWNEVLAELEKRGLAVSRGGRHEVPGGVIPWLEARSAEWRLDVYRDQVAVHLQQMLAECRRQTGRGQFADALRYLEAEWCNLRAAFAWALQRAESDQVDMEDHFNLVIDYCSSLFHLFTNKGMLGEGLGWMGEGVKAGEVVGDRPQETALMRDYRGVLRVQVNDRLGAREDFVVARTAFGELGERMAQAMAAYHLGQLCYEEDDLDTALECFEEALVPMRGVEANRTFAAQASTFLGQIYLKKGEFENAREEFEDAIELYREGVVSPDLPVAARFGLAQAAFLDDRMETAQAFTREAVEAMLLLPPRIATGGVSQVIGLARTLSSRADGFPLLGELADALDAQLKSYRSKPPRPEFVRDWQLTCEVFDRVSAVVRTAAAAANGDADARQRLPEQAAETDRITGGVLNLSAWSGELLAADG